MGGEQEETGRANDGSQLEHFYWCKRANVGRSLTTASRRQRKASRASCCLSPLLTATSTLKLFKQQHPRWCCLHSNFLTDSVPTATSTPTLIKLQHPHWGCLNCNIHSDAARQQDSCFLSQLKSRGGLFVLFYDFNNVLGDGKHTSCAHFILHHCCRHNNEGGPLCPRRCPLQVYAFCLPVFVHASARKTQTRMNACRQAHTHTNYMACGFKAPLQEAATVCDLWRLEAELLLQSLVPCGVQADGATSALLIL